MCPPGEDDISKASENKNVFFLPLFLPIVRVGNCPQVGLACLPAVSCSVYLGSCIPDVSALSLTKGGDHTRTEGQNSMFEENACREYSRPNLSVVLVYLRLNLSVVLVWRLPFLKPLPFHQAPRASCLPHL